MHVREFHIQQNWLNLMPKPHMPFVHSTESPTSFVIAAVAVVAIRRLCFVCIVPFAVFGLHTNVKRVYMRSWLPRASWFSRLPLAMWSIVCTPKKIHLAVLCGAFHRHIFTSSFQTQKERRIRTKIISRAKRLCHCSLESKRVCVRSR